MQPDTPNPTPTETPTVTTPTPPESKKKFNLGGKKTKLAGIIVAGIILLGAVGAGAYYGVYLPNTPQNVLKKSVANTLKQEKISGKGTASISGKDSATATAAYTLQTDSTKNAAAATIDISVSGIKLPLEVRSVDKAVYLKVGDLTTIQALATASLGAESAGLVDTISKQVSNKWIEFDESLIKTASDKCSVLTENGKLSDSDVDKLVGIYDKNEFIEIKKTSSDTVDGRKVTKAELGLNKEKAKTFGKDIEQLDIFKKLKECSGDANSKTIGATQGEEFKGSYELTAWVDKSKKELVKVAVKVTDDKNSMSADFTFNKDQVNIVKPEGAIPAMQLLSQFAPLLGTGSGLPSTTE